MEARSLREEARGLILGGTIFASLMLFAISSSATTLSWGELGMIGGMAGSVLSYLPYLHLLHRQVDRHGRRMRVPLFWKGVALLVLFGFWFSAALSLNTAWSWSGPVERIDGVVSGKRVSKGRYSNSYMVQLWTPKGPVETMVPRDVWETIPEGRRFRLNVCGGVLGYPYVVTPLDTGPFIDIKRLVGLRDASVDLGC